MVRGEETSVSTLPTCRVPFQNMGFIVMDFNIRTLIKNQNVKGKVLEGKSSQGLRSSGSFGQISV